MCLVKKSQKFYTTGWEENEQNKDCSLPRVVIKQWDIVYEEKRLTTIIK